ncbi:hypothetical protein CRUP_030278 [Coryphaenoides rupestris]|nr:hypothetical protein CRUP_030278 [Coryphaenoides rupestris]
MTEEAEEEVVEVEEQVETLGSTSAGGGGGASGGGSGPNLSRQLMTHMRLLQANIQYLKANCLSEER